MELPVHTALMRLERRLYQVGDVELPQPVTLAEAGVFLGSLALLIAVGHALGVGLDPSWAWLYVFVPWLAARTSTSLVADRKRLHQWALSQVRYMLAEPRLLARLRPVREPAEVWLPIHIWQPGTGLGATTRPGGAP